MKTIPQDTHFAPLSIITDEEILRRLRFVLVHGPNDQSFLLLAPGPHPRSDPKLSPDSVPESAFKLTGTAQPAFLCAPPS